MPQRQQFTYNTSMPVQQPVLGKDAMDGFVPHSEVAFLARHHNEGEVVAMGGSGGFEQTAHLAVVELGAGSSEVVGGIGCINSVNYANIFKGKLHESASFRRPKLHKSASFRRLKLHKTANFRRAKLHKTASFH